MATIITSGIDYQQLLDDLRALVRHEIQASPNNQTVQQPASDEKLTVRASAELLDVSEATIYEWLRRGILSSKKLGGRTYLLKSIVLSAGIPRQRTLKPARAKHRPP